MALTSLVQLALILDGSTTIYGAGGTDTIQFGASAMSTGESTLVDGGDQSDDFDPGCLCSSCICIDDR